MNGQGLHYDVKSCSGCRESVDGIRRRNSPIVGAVDIYNGNVKYGICVQACLAFGTYWQRLKREVCPQ